LLAEGLGQDELRVAYFDCTQSWLYPEGNGWYVVPLQDNAWTADRLQHARTAYEQTRPSSVPPFAVHEWFEQNPLVGLSPASVTAVPADWVPQRAEQEGVTLEGPVSVGDALEFLGAHGAEDSVSSDSSMVLVTYWRVVRPPVQPFSLMAHLVGHDGVPIAVGDGLGVSIDQLQSGDIIAQRHELSIPPEALPGVYWLQIGAYTLPDVQRLPIIMALDEVVGDRMLIGRVEVSSS